MKGECKNSGLLLDYKLLLASDVGFIQFLQVGNKVKVGNGGFVGVAEEFYLVVECVKYGCFGGKRSEKFACFCGSPIGNLGWVIGC